jgi:hypothetical protein
MGSESNFDVVQLSAERVIVLNWNLTLISLPVAGRSFTRPPAIK